jgi:8-amino-7-oxononanoate synthase
MPPLRDYALEQLARTADKGLTRRLVETERLGGMRVRRGGKEFVSFSCNDYLGLTQHPKVIAAAREALERYGTGAAASRLVTGNHRLYADLERLLAEMKGTESALVFGSGYLANVGVISALVGEDDLIVADRLCHACMWDGARLSGATVIRFAHNDLDACRDILEAHRREHERCLILTETVFSMDGDRAPVGELGELARAQDAWLMTDDAHGLGFGSSVAADVQMGTLSKAVGSCGGYVCGAAELIDWLTNRSRTLLFSTGLPPASVAAAVAALRIIRDDEALRARAMENARRFTDALGRPEASSPIVPVIVGTPARALAASAMLQEHGLLAVAIRPPSVPAGTARLRFAFSALHEAGPIERAAALLKEHGYA